MSSNLEAPCTGILQRVPGDMTSAINDALNSYHRVCLDGGVYNVSGPVLLKGRGHLIGNWSTILQTASDVPILEMDSTDFFGPGPLFSYQNNRSGASNLTLRYRNAQPSTNIFSRGIQLNDLNPPIDAGNVISNSHYFRGIEIIDSAQGLYGDDANVSGSIFISMFDNITITDASLRPFYLAGAIAGQTSPGNNNNFVNLTVRNTVPQPNQLASVIGTQISVYDNILFEGVDSNPIWQFTSSRHNKISGVTFRNCNPSDAGTVYMLDLERGINQTFVVVPHIRLENSSITGAVDSAIVRVDRNGILCNDFISQTGSSFSAGCGSAWLDATIRGAWNKNDGPGLGTVGPGTPNEWNGV